MGKGTGEVKRAYRRDGRLIRGNELAAREMRLSGGWWWGRGVQVDLVVAWNETQENG